MNILVALNANYLYPLKVMLKSLFMNNRGCTITVYMMYSKLNENEIKDIQEFVSGEGHRLVPVFIHPGLFDDALVYRHFSSEMYYRLIAFRYLPESVDRILYLDPDIINLNPVFDLYRKPFGNAFFMACEHAYSARMAGPFNKMRLKTPKAKGYFNTGVLMMNIKALRKSNSLKKIMQFTEKHKHLLLPDQDIFNALYWDKIISIPGMYYNYDARYYNLTRIFPTNKDQANPKWIKAHTVFIHYCGGQKPWQPGYKGNLGFFFNFYARRYAEDEAERRERRTPVHETEGH